jgi:hypothetical protein
MQQEQIVFYSSGSGFIFSSIAFTKPSDCFPTKVTIEYATYSSSSGEDRDFNTA